MIIVKKIKSYVFKAALIFLSALQTTMLFAAVASVDFNNNDVVAIFCPAAGKYVSVGGESGQWLTVNGPAKDDLASIFRVVNKNGNIFQLQWNDPAGGIGWVKGSPTSFVIDIDKTVVAASDPYTQIEIVNGTYLKFTHAYWNWLSGLYLRLCDSGQTGAWLWATQADAEAFVIEIVKKAPVQVVTTTTQTTTFVATTAAPVATTTTVLRHLPKKAPAKTTVVVTTTSPVTTTTVLRHLPKKAPAKTIVTKPVVAAIQPVKRAETTIIKAPVKKVVKKPTAVDEKVKAPAKAITKKPAAKKKVEMKKITVAG